jgi:hypothetical protein
MDGSLRISKKDFLVVLLVTIGLGVPFLDKPVHIDDPVVLAIGLEPCCQPGK